MADAMETAQVVKVGEGFYVRVAVDNIAWIDMGDWGLAVDALEQPHLETEVFEEIQSTLGDEPIRYLLNTHTHYDHVALNAAFQRRYGTEIVNQRTARVPPEGKWFEGGGRRALMLPLPGTHTSEDCVVWIPDDKALFTGDIFGWGLIPLSRGLDAKSVKLLLETCARMIEFDASVVVPGHGPLCTNDELKRWVEYFHWLVREVSGRCDGGQSERQIMREIAPPRDMDQWWRFEMWKHEDSLSKVLRAVRAGQLDESSLR